MSKSREEVLAARLVPRRRTQWLLLNNRTRPADVVCKGCLKHYQRIANKAFSPECNLTTDIQIREQERVLNELTPDEVNQYWYAKDPIAWAKVELGWDPRWYQIDVLRCTALHKILRFGRQSGKCCKGSVHIDLRSGERAEIGGLVGKTVEVLSRQGTTTTFRKAVISKNAVKSCVRVGFRSGRELDVSTDHPFSAFDRWIEAEDLRLGDRIASVGRGTFGTDPMPDQEAEVLGFAIGDGGLTGGAVKMTNINPVIIARAEDLAEHYGCHLNWESDTTFTFATLTPRRGTPQKEYIQSNAIRLILRKHEVFGKRSKDKVVPIGIQRAPQRTVALFLNRLYACDGWACVSKGGGNQIGYCSASKALARGVQDLLFKFGIYSNLAEKRPKLNGKCFRAWQVIISCGASIRKFAEEISILSKEEAVQHAVDCIRPPTNNERSIADTLPKEARKLAKDALHGRPEHRVCPDIRILRDRGLSRRVAHVLADRIGAPALQAWVDSAILWDEVISLEYIGKHQTYDLSVLDADTYDDANFSAEGIFVHNTEALAVTALFDAVNASKAEIIVLCPNQEHVDIIFKRIRSFMSKSDLLNDEKFKVVDTRDPQRIEFCHPDGNSTIRGIPAGSSKKADRIRGHTPTHLIIDEMDLLTEEALDSAISAIHGAGAHTKITASSTPTGQHAKFFQWCTVHSIGFKEFHRASSVSPNWTDEIELLYRQTCSINTYAHEFDADWGELEAGVFPTKHIQTSLLSYDILDATPTKHEFYVIGVDWNRIGTGANIIIVGYNMADEKFRVAYREVVDPDAFTQHVAIERIVELNRIWNPKYIYVDVGDGTTQVEALHLRGMQEPATRLHSRVKAIDFGAKVEISDPLQGLVKKSVKPLMVDLCVRQLEAGRVILPESEDNKYGLVGQIRDYRIKRYGKNGPVYQDGNDHMLVAWMLSIYAFLVEMSELTGPSVGARPTMVLQGATDSMSFAKAVEEEAKRKERLAPVSRVAAFRGGDPAKPRTGLGRISRPMWRRSRF